VNKPDFHSLRVFLVSYSPLFSLTVDTNLLL